MRIGELGAYQQPVMVFFHITTGQILANGFHIVAGPSVTANIIVAPGMTSGSGINLTIIGQQGLTVVDALNPPTPPAPPWAAECFCWGRR